MFKTSFSKLKEWISTLDLPSIWDQKLFDHSRSRRRNLHRRLIAKKSQNNHKFKTEMYSK